MLSTRGSVIAEPHTNQLFVTDYRAGDMKEPAVDWPLATPLSSTGGDPSEHDSEIDEVAWLTFDEALARATHPSEQALIAKAHAMLSV